jgi:hypothetical protein
MEIVILLYGLLEENNKYNTIQYFHHITCFQATQHTRQRHIETTKQLVQTLQNIPYSSYEIILIEEPTGTVKTTSLEI